MNGVANTESYRLYDQEWGSYEELYESFEWELPETFNIATHVCDHWATDQEKIALYDHTPTSGQVAYTYAELQVRANQLAHFLRESGVKRGDHIGITASKKPEVVMAHIAVWKLGAVAVPLNTLFGPDALQYRLTDADIDACLVDEALIDRLSPIQDEVDLDVVVNIDAPETAFDHVEFDDALSGKSKTFDTVETDPDDPAIIIYTSGTTGDPKGVVHGHRVILGNLPYYFMFILNMNREKNDVFYSTADWGWVASVAMLWSPLFDGVPVVANDGQFDPAEELAIIDEYDVTTYFNAPTGIRQLMQLDTSDYDLTSVRVLASGGEEVTQDIFDWVDVTFDDAVISQGYGQTEIPGMVCTCEELIETKSGRLGVAIPGHEVAIVDPDTTEVITEPNTVGEIAVRYENDPVCHKEYLNKPDETAEIRQNGWQLTGDLGEKDAEGYFKYKGRKDDVIISSGYRIGPSEIEESLTHHEAVVQAGVIGVPHDERGEIPKAYIVLADGYEPSSDLEDELEQHVRDRLARYKYPQYIEFVDNLPTTATGKVRRTDLREREGIDS